MDINERFLAFALQGSSWVLWVLIGLSVLALTVAAERALRLRRAAAGQSRLRALALRAWTTVASDPDLAEDELTRLASRSNASRSPAASMIQALRGASEAGIASARRIVAATRAYERRVLERYISVLGTIGANAPFIGLFGTVLEILRVFGLVGEGGMGSSAQSGAIMAGISEALVATGVGLLVAIPAVVAFNALTKWVDTIFGQADEVAEVAFAMLESEGGNDGRGAVE